MQNKSQTNEKQMQNKCHINAKPRRRPTDAETNAKQMPKQCETNAKQMQILRGLFAGPVRPGPVARCLAAYCVTAAMSHNEIVVMWNPNNAIQAQAILVV